jgi:DNA-binding SARP family transcriptional activator/DNA-binding CsgD family transcriptional regulator
VGGERQALRFRVLGPLEVIGAAHPVGGPRRLALLAVLLVERGHPVSADLLVDELWGDDPPATVANTLQVHIAALRRALPGCISTAGRGYQLDVEPEQVDSCRFADLLEEAGSASDGGERWARLVEALALWRGDPFMGVPQTPLVAAAARQLQEQRLTALEQRIDAELSRGRHEALVPELEGLAAAHPERERLTGQHMLALHRSGRSADALRVFAELCEALDSRLGVDPSDDLVELERAIRRADPALAPRRVPREDDPATLTRLWPLFGRDNVLWQATGALASGRGVVLVGDPGVGKTRLAQELLASVRRRRLPARWVAATQAAASIPFGPLAHLLPDSLPAGGDRLRSLQRTLTAMVELGEGGRLVLGVDDAHLLDEHSAALVHLGVSSGVLQVVATTRAGVSTPDWVTALWKDDLAERIEVRRLARKDTIALAAAILGGDLDQRTAHLLWRAALGNPLYLRELLVTGLGSGRLRRADGLWRWRGALQVGSRLEDVVGSHLGQLSPELRATLETVAVAQQAELGVIEDVADADALADAEATGLVVLVRDGRRTRVQLGHPLYGEVLRQTMPRQRRIRILGALAGALEATGARRRGDVLRAVDWRVQAGLPVPETLVLAGARRAREIGDWQLAERLLGSTDPARLSNDARLVLGDVLYADGRLADADAALAQLDPAGLASEPLAEATMVRLWARAPSPGREAEALLEELARDPAGAPPWLPACRAHLALLRGDVAAAAAILRHAGESVPALFARAITAGRGGDLLRALELTDRALAVMRDDALVSVRREVMGARIGAAVGAGYFEQAPVEQMHGAAVALGDRPGVLFSAGMSCLLASIRGDAGAVRRWMAELADVIRVGPASPGIVLGYACLARMHALLGEVGAAESAITAMDVPREGRALRDDAELTRSRTAVAAAGGDLAGAALMALEGADRALRLGQVADAVNHAWDAAQCGQVESAAIRLEPLAAGLTGSLLPLLATEVLAWRRGDGGALDAVSRGYAAIGANLLAAGAAVLAVRTFSRAGGRAPTALAIARATILRERCAGFHTPVLDAGAAASPLTERELRIAEMVERGLTNREIGATLGISARTVETHLRHVYDKLDVGDRDRLAEGLGTGSTAS